LPRLQRATRQLNPFVEASFHVGDADVTHGVQGLSLRDIEVARIRQHATAWSRDLDERKAATLSDEDKCMMLYESEVIRSIDLPGMASAANRLGAALVREGRPGTAACVADALFNRGAFKEAIASFERAKPDDGAPARATLAWARLHAGDPHGASAEMLRFVQARAASGTINAFDLADASALLARTGQALPATLAARTRELPDGPWPRPVLALQAGTLAPAQLLAQADALQGDARALALDEAWYFIGEQHLARGDRRSARVAFEHVRAHAPTGTRVRARALAELTSWESTDPDPLAA
jgi:hypothetical protein